jgi:hypothetical protein
MCLKKEDKEKVPPKEDKKKKKDKVKLEDIRRWDADPDRPVDVTEALSSPAKPRRTQGNL